MWIGTANGNVQIHEEQDTNYTSYKVYVGDICPQFTHWLEAITENDDWGDGYTADVVNELTEEHLTKTLPTYEAAQQWMMVEITKMAQQYAVKFPTSKAA